MIHSHKPSRKFRYTYVCILISFFALWCVLAWGKPQEKFSPKAQEKKISALIKDAQRYYENADFQMAAVYYKEALDLAPDRKDLKLKLDETEKKIKEQKQLRAQIPKDPEKKKAFLKQKYSNAKKLYSQKKYSLAYREFYQLWLIAGKYKRTSSYIRKIQKQMKKEMEKARLAKEEKLKKAQEERARRLAEIERKKKEAEELVTKANRYLAKGKYEKARKYFNKALELDSVNKMAREGLIKVKEAEAKAAQAEALRKSKEEEARRQAEIERRKKEAEELVAKGNKYLARGDFDRAISCFTRALELDKENKPAQQGIVRAKQEKERRLLAEKEREKKKELIESRLERGIALYKEKQFETALKEFKSVLALDSNNKTAQKYAKKCESRIKEFEKEKAEAEARKKQISENLAKAQEMINKGDYEGAIACYKAVLKLDKDNKNAKFGIRRAEDLLAMKKQKEEAEALRKRKIAKLIKRANLALADSDYKEAKELFNEILKIDPANEKAKQGLAKAQSLEQEAKKREIELAQAKKKEQKKKVKKEPKKEKIKPQKKEEEKPVPTEAEKQRKELEEIKRIRREQREKAEKLTNKGKELFQRGKYEDALRCFEEALSLQPLFIEAQEYKKKTEEKIAELKREEELRRKEEKRRKELQKQAERLYDEAEQLYKQRKFEQAEKKLNEALSLIPDFEKATRLLGKVKEAKKDYIKKQARELVEEGISLYKKGDYKGAIEKFNAGLRIDPTNEVATRYITLSMQKIEEQKKEEQQRQLEAKKSEAKRLFKEGLTAYQQKNPEEAVNKWKQALKVYPELKEAQAYLEKTKEEYQQYLSSKAKKEEFLAKEESAKKKMNTLVNIETKRPIPLRDFLRNLYIITDIDFYVAEGIEATVEAKFEDKPLYEVLDTVLLPIGLKWERKPGTDIVIVSPDLKMRAFELTPAQLTKIKALMDSKFIQRMLWGGKTEPSLKGVELTLDERESILFMTDSKKNIQKMESFLRDLAKEAPPTLEWRSYKIDPRYADKIKAILEAMLEVEKPTPYSRERRILISGDELVIKDTPENIKKAEQILMNKNFIKKIKEQKLVAEVFDITPQGATQENITQVEDFGKYVKAVVENMLYAKTGRSAAEAEGRRLWLRSYVEPPNKPKLTLTVVDYPDNIEAVADLIARLPEVKKGLRSEIIFLKYAKAADISSYLESVLGIAAAPTEVTAAAGLQIRKTMRVEDEIQFRDIFVRLTRVNENDVADDNDDSAEFVVRTPTSSEDITIDEFHSEFVDDYEIVAEDIRPSGSPGQGRVKVLIRYVPQGGAVTTGMGAAVTPTPTPVGAVAEAEAAPPISIEPFEDLNALLIRYTDPAKYSEVKHWIEKLDFPTPQVSIEAKFVEVLENRAKEYSSEFTIMNLGEGVDLDSSIFNMRFGQYMDEFRDELEPPIEYTTMANLLKGTTIFNWIIAGGESPINYQLRLLEAEGIINVVNGPTITTLSGESADFIIERDPGYYQYDPENDEYVLRPITHVDMSVTPYVTQLGVITLDIDAEIRDFESNLGTAVYLQRPTAETGVGPLAVYHSNTDRSVIRKDLTTIARVQDGGTIVLGGWSGEHTAERHSGVPVFRNLPYIGQLLFGRNLKTVEKTTLLIFLTANVVK
ncbi:tetratricopeptide repeat protein [Candidatus Sumerlaeota bacterium]|nr:tetratricopeptide repeat protein [Candidatus Sumerlaeota bacterium]